MAKEKIGGVAETMLQTLHARAKESGKPKVVKNLCVLRNAFRSGD